MSKHIAMVFLTILVSGFFNSEISLAQLNSNQVAEVISAINNGNISYQNIDSLERVIFNSKHQINKNGFDLAARCGCYKVSGPGPDLCYLYDHDITNCNKRPGCNWTCK